MTDDEFWRRLAEYDGSSRFIRSLKAIAERTGTLTEKQKDAGMVALETDTSEEWVEHLAKRIAFYLRQDDREQADRELEREHARYAEGFEHHG
jgi:hypothetical protein